MSSSATVARLLVAANDTASINSDVRTIQDALLIKEMDIAWMLQTGYLVFFMQCGFALFEAGAVRLKNIKNILLKNVADTCVAALVWYGVGFAFAYGKCGDGVFIGHSNFFLSDSSQTEDSPENGRFYASWFISFAVAAISCTIPGGAVAERMQFRAYIIYATVMAGLAYPVVVYWNWSLGGWLSPRRIDCETGQPDVLLSQSNGVMDFSGSGVVHVSGGTAALVAIAILGARAGRFTSSGDAIAFRPNSPAMMTLGVLILWFTWYGFNAGSTRCMYGCMYTASLVSVNTTLAAATGGLTVLLVSFLIGKPGDIAPTLNGILSGLVAITSGCAVVLPYAAVVIGGGAGLLYMVSTQVMLRLRLDDVVDAVPVHLVSGVWGMVNVGLWATQERCEAVLGFANDWGVFYGGQGYQLGAQILGVVMIMLWITLVMVPTFLLLKWARWLRVSKEEEALGLDFAQSLGNGFSILNFANPANWVGHAG